MNTNTEQMLRIREEEIRALREALFELQIENDFLRDTLFKQQDEDEGEATEDPCYA